MADFISRLTAIVSRLFRHWPTFSIMGAGCPLAITNSRSCFTLTYTSNMQHSPARRTNIPVSFKKAVTKMQHMLRDSDRATFPSP